MGRYKTFFWLFSLVVLILLVFQVAHGAKSAPFVSVWDTRYGNKELASVTLPLKKGAQYNFTVEWGDGEVGKVEGYDDLRKKHIYQKHGLYTIKIQGRLDQLLFEGQEARLQIREIKHWGDIKWKSMDRAFLGCQKLVISSKTPPDLSRVISLSRMFQDSNVSIAHVKQWNTENVRDMSFMFSGTNFNSSLNEWDVSNVVNIEGMFAYNRAFNSRLDKWDVKNVTNMRYLFNRATSFNQSLNDWNTESLLFLFGAFISARSFNQPLNKWKVGKVRDFGFLFWGAKNFNQPLDKWNVTNAENFTGFFGKTNKFNQDLSTWNVKKVSDMTSMFRSAYAFNGDLSGWNVKSLRFMDFMFMRALKFNSSIESWKTIKVESMESTFKEAETFNQNISKWNVSMVKSMQEAFRGASSFNQDLSKWKVGEVRACQLFDEAALKWKRERPQFQDKSCAKH